MVIELSGMLFGLMALLKALIPRSVLGSRKCRCDHSSDMTFCQPFSFVTGVTNLNEF